MKRQANKRKPLSNANTTQVDASEANAGTTNNIDVELSAETGSKHETSAVFAPPLKNDRGTACKRKKLHSSVSVLFETTKNSLQASEDTPIVLTPRSLFTALCQVHENEYPGMLSTTNIATIKQGLPTTS